MGKNIHVVVWLAAFVVCIHFMVESVTSGEILYFWLWLAGVAFFGEVLNARGLFRRPDTDLGNDT